MFYLVEIFRTQAQEEAPQVTMRELLQEGGRQKGEARLYRSFAAKGR